MTIVENYSEKNRSPPHPILLSIANKGLTAIWCVTAANAGLTGALIFKVGQASACAGRDKITS
jgi:hypothetical protein